MSRARHLAANALPRHPRPRIDEGAHELDELLVVFEAELAAHERLGPAVVLSLV